MRQCPAGVRAGQRRKRAGKSGRACAFAPPSGPRPARRPPICAERGVCAAVAYPTDSAERVFELPMPARAHVFWSGTA